jgi:putative endonuclease
LHGGEIDIVCRDREVLVFVEVKTRSSEAFGRPSAAVDQKKRRLLLRAAMSWLRMLDMPDVAFRFDILEVLDGSPPEIRHIENAFTLPSPFHY